MDIVLFAESFGETDGDCGFDDDCRIGTDGLELFGDGFYGTSVEVVSFRIVVGRGGDDDEIRFLCFVDVQ